MRKSTIIGALVAVGIAVTGCSSSEQPSPMPPAPGTPPPPSAIAPAKDDNDGDETKNVNTDLAFAQQMVAHHEAEVELIEIGLRNTDNERVQTLAERFERQHESQIEQLRAWLESHGQSSVAPQDVGPGEGAQMPGVATQELLGKIEEAQEGRVALLWVKAMRTHHQKVVDIAANEIAEGTDPQLRRLAQEIRSTREAELEELKELQREL